jgi:CHAT domain-containing protein
MSLKSFFRINYRQVKKWVTVIVLAVLAAVFSAGFSLAFPHFIVRANVAEFPQLAASNSAQLLERGREFFQAGQFSQAATVWREAGKGFQGAGDKLNQALAFSYLSLVYQQLGEWQAATEAINSSLSILQGKEIGNKDRSPILAQALNTQGHLKLALGEAEQALEIWEKATAQYAQIGDVEGTIGSQINQAQALQSLGMYRRARKVLEGVEISLQNQSNSLVKATGLLSLGNSLQAIGELEKSRQLLQESLKIAQDLRSASASSAAFFSLGNTTRILAKKAEEAGEIEAAQVELEKAIKAYQQAAELSNSLGLRTKAQVNQFSLLVDQRQFAEAENLRSQINLQELPPSRQTVYALINYSQSLLQLAKGQGKTGNYQEVAQILARAIQQAKSLKDAQIESYALGNLGELYEETQQFKEAQNLTKEALVLAQSINASHIAYRWQWQLGRLFKEQGKKQEALATYTVAVETLKSLRNDLVAINLDNPDVQFSFRESVEPVYRELVDLLITIEAETSQENLIKARSVIESLQLAELDNFFQEACLDAKPKQVDQIDENAAIIYPIILQDKLAIIAALPKSPLRLYSTIKLQAEIADVLDELQQDIGRIAADNQRIKRLSQEVYDWIIRPLEADLKAKEIKTLVFVSDGILRKVPMAALHDGQQYLIEKYNIASTPGLQLLPPQPLKREQFIVLAAGLSEARAGFSPLPNVERELQQINSQVRTKKLFNQEFTNYNLQQSLNLVSFPVVHLATHGQFSSRADKTFIITWDNQINVKNLDDLLKGREQKFALPIELLVFSACETARGDERAALGLAGVALRAGARSTLATLWRVSDDSTATLMSRFYSELANNSNVTKAEALRRAQLSLLQEQKYRFPYFWAPYVLVGNWQ